MASYTPIDNESVGEHFGIKFSNGDEDALTEPEMWSAIERDIGVLPVYLKNILSINGYNHLLSLEELDEEAIGDIEKFAQENMKHYVPNTEAFFYIFKTNPSDFRIVSGHRKLLLKLRDRIRQNGVRYYTHLKVLPMMQLKPEQLFFSDDTPSSVPTPNLPSLTPQLFFSDDTPSTASISVSAPNPPSPISKSKRRKRNHIPEMYSAEDKIRLLVYNWFTKYTDEVLDMQSIGTAACATEDNKIYGVIICPVCSAQVKIGSEKNKDGSNRWIISNYVKHFQKYHASNFSNRNGFKIEIP